MAPIRVTRMPEQAILLLGGRGTRLSQLYPDRPKALAPVAGRPFLAWQIDWLRRGGITNIHLAAGYKSNVVTDWLQDQRNMRDVTLSVEPEPLGTAGALKFCEPHLQGDLFYVLNGDSLTPHLNFAAMSEAAEQGTSSLTIAVTPIESAGRYGTVEFDDHHRITAFREKSERAAGWINAGVYMVHRDILSRIPAGKNVSLELDLFPGAGARTDGRFSHRASAARHGNAGRVGGDGALCPQERTVAVDSGLWTVKTIPPLTVYSPPTTVHHPPISRRRPPHLIAKILVRLEDFEPDADAVADVHEGIDEQQQQVGHSLRLRDD